MSEGNAVNHKRLINLVAGRRAEKKVRVAEGEPEEMLGTSRVIKKAS
jgi:hypothetical protein